MGEIGLREAEQVLRERFQIFTSPVDDAVWTVPAKSLLNRDSLLDFLNEYMNLLGAEDLATAASRFSYHMKDSILYGGTYALAHWNLYFDWSPENVSYVKLTESPLGHNWGIVLDRVKINPIGEVSDTIKNFPFRFMFMKHFNPIFTQLSVLSGLSTRVLWENLAHVIFLKIPLWQDETDSRIIKNRFDSIYNSLLQMAPQFVGRNDSNPLSEALIHLEESTNGNETAMRRSCCLNYRLEEYCRECPLTHHRNA